MSLIGPRPERPAFCAEFEKRIHGWRYRTYVKPGLSGLAQVSGGYDLLPREKGLARYVANCKDMPQNLIEAIVDASRVRKNLVADGAL